MKFDFNSEEIQILEELIRQKLKELQNDPLVKKPSDYMAVIKHIQYRLSNNG